MRIGLGILGFLAAFTAVRAASAQSIVIDGSKPHQVMDGWINQMRVWDDPHLTETYRPAKPGEDSGRSAVDIPLAAQNDILTKLYGDLGITHVQTAIEPGAQPVQGGPFNFNWKRCDAHSDYVKQARPFGLQKSIFWNERAAGLSHRMQPRSSA